MIGEVSSIEYQIRIRRWAIRGGLRRKLVGEGARQSNNHQRMKCIKEEWIGRNSNGNSIVTAIGLDAVHLI